MTEQPEPPKAGEWSDDGIIDLDSLSNLSGDRAVLSATVKQWIKDSHQQAVQQAQTMTTRKTTMPIVMSSYTQNRTLFRFANDEDAILFKLRWEGVEL